MAFEKGTTALTIFRLSEKLPENALELFEEKAAGAYQDTGSEECVGWVSGRHLLERRIDEETAICGGSYYLNLRITQRKVPPALLQAECKMKELDYMQENGTDFVPTKVKRDIKSNIEDLRLKQMPPQLAGIPMVYDRSSNLIYVGTASNKSIDTFLSFFYDTFKTEPIHINFEDIMIRNFQETPEILPKVTFSDSMNEDDFLPGRDFLTWLWYFSEEKGAQITLDTYGGFNLMIEGPLTLALVDESQGAGETVVKKGMPQRSAEAKAALSVGKKLKKAKINLTRGENIWSCTFDADNFAFSGLALPDGEEMDIHSAFAERVNFLHIFNLAIEEYLKTFIETLKSDSYEEELKKIHQWSSEREAV